MTLGPRYYAKLWHQLNRLSLLLSGEPYNPKRPRLPYCKDFSVNPKPTLEHYDLRPGDIYDEIDTGARYIFDGELWILKKDYIPTSE